MIPEWKLFEKAVASFVAAIGNGAKVTHDAQIPDEHTGRPRQRDVWVEFDLGGHFPAKALVSCKCWSEPLNEQDIDHFNGEFISSGAQIGVIYAKTGFNQAAVEKASRLRFHCCRLYQNEPTDLPQALLFTSCYVFRPQFQITVNGDASLYGFKKWQDVLSLATDHGTVMSIFHNALSGYIRCKDASQRWEFGKNGDLAIVQIRDDARGYLDIELRIRDNIFEAQMSFSLLEGSYNITSDKFLGTQSTPFIDTQNLHPGDGWVEAEAETLPDVHPKNCIVFFYRFDIDESLNRFAASDITA